MRFHHDVRFYFQKATAWLFVLFIFFFFDFRSSVTVLITRLFFHGTVVKAEDSAAGRLYGRKGVFFRYAFLLFLR